MSILYLGTHPPSKDVIHYPIIKIVPKAIPQHLLDEKYTHVIFTSKNAVDLCNIDLAGKTVIAIGRATAERLKGCVPLVPEEETQEGIVELLRPLDLDDAYFFLPRSSLARKTLDNFFRKREIRYQTCDLYDTVTQKLEPLPNLDEIDEIVFTSPSTVRAFVEIFSEIPKNKKLTCQGPITEEALYSLNK